MDVNTSADLQKWHERLANPKYSNENPTTMYQFIYIYGRQVKKIQIWLELYVWLKLSPPFNFAPLYQTWSVWSMDYELNKTNPRQQSEFD